MKELFFYFKKNKALSITSLLLALALFVQTGYVKRLQNDITNITDAKYQKAFFDLSTALSNIDTSLGKALITDEGSHLNLIANEIGREASYARACLGDLPKKDVNLKNSQKFLSQVSDYILMLSSKTSKGEKLGVTERKNLKNLSAYADKLSSSVLEMENQFLTGELDFNSIVSASADDEAANGHLKNLEAQFENYPSLIYDGPFSDHISTLNAKALENEPEIDKNTARKKAVDFLNFQGTIKLNDASDATGKIETYGFFAETKNNSRIFIDVTKKGGHIISYLNSKEVYEDNIPFASAVEKAEEFLKSKGFNSFKSSFYEKSNGIITINFFPEYENVTLYSDLIKIKVAADDCSIIGFDQKNYLENHTRRYNLIPSLTQEQAKQSLNSELDIKSSKLCLIPLYSGKEVLCYEYSGSFNNKDYLCYVNANNGHIEKIYLILKDKNRILAV